jgi:hypothetical protein
MRSVYSSPASLPASERSAPRTRVPTEAELARAEGRDYEPASALLERIRMEREAAGPTAARGRKKAALAKGTAP